MEKFSFSIFSIFYGVFATFWLSGTSSRTVNAAKSLDFPVKFYQTLSQTHEKTQNFQKPFFFIIWIYVKYTCMQYQFDRLNITIRKNPKTFFAHLIFLLLVLLSDSHWVFTTFSSKMTKNRQISVGILDFSKIYPTLKSCISELNEYFLMGPVPLQRFMYKL